MSKQNRAPSKSAAPVTGVATPFLSFYRDRLSSDVESNRSRFDRESGRFLTDGGWAVTNQDIVYPLALLFLDPENPYYNDESILDLVFRGGDAWRTFQNPDGTVEFVKVDGSTWGPIYMPWSMYFWLETYDLVSKLLDDRRRRQWEDGLRLAYNGICSTLTDEAVHNIPVWNAAAAYRAGEVFGEEGWQNAGLAMIQKAVAEQDPKGYWPEHEGPTPSYNYVYVQALGIYYAASGDESVLPALEAAARFHSRYTYPDGRIVETIDGRVRYHDWVPFHGHVGLSVTLVGRDYLGFLVRQTERDLERGSAEVVSRYGLNPHYGLAFAFWSEHSSTDSGPSDQTDDSLRLTWGDGCIEDPGLAVVCRHGPWFYCLSEFLAPTGESRWGQDRQQFVSIYHHRFGLLCGGGNSKNQPEWSTFLRRLPSEAAYLPSSAALDEVAVNATDGTSPNSASPAETGGSEQAYSHRLRCVVGGADFELSLRPDADRRLVTNWSGPADGEARLLLRLRHGMQIRLGSGAVHQVDLSVPLHLETSEITLCPGAEAITIQLPESTRLEWPVSPFNPYAKSGTAPAHDSVALLVFPVGKEPANAVFTDFGGECNADTSRRGATEATE